MAGPEFARYGGFTTCYEVLHRPDHRLLVDAGSGIHHLNRSTGPARRYSVLLTHLHWDHIQGLPFFPALYDPETTVDFHGRQADGLPIEEAIEGVMRPPWFPVSFKSSAGVKRFLNLDGVLELDDLRVQWAALHHPSGVTGYRFERAGRCLVIATDVEAGDPASDLAVRRLAAGADVLVHDAQYLPEEYARSKVGWGHSTWEQAVAVAVDAGVGRLVLTSHDPDRADEGVDEIVAAARAVFPATEAAFSGMTIEV